MKVKNYISSALLKGMAVASLAFGLGAGASNAQSYTQNFDLPSSIFSAGWAQQNLSSPIGTTNWFPGNPTVFPAYNGADSTWIGANYNNVAGAATISNWLFSPTRTYDNGHTFSFWTRTVASPAYPDRMEVRLSTNGASVNVGATSTSVGDFTTVLLDINPTLTTTGYPNVWTQYTITLSGLAGPTSGRIAFRYFVTNGGPSGANSDLIGIDNVVYTVPVAGDATMLTADTLEYTIVPLDHQSTAPFNGTIRNNGTNALSNVFMQVNVYDGSMSQVYTANSATTASLAAAATANFSVPAFTAASADLYTFEYIAKHSQVDGNAADDTLYNSVLIDNSYYARDNGNVTGGLGIGAGNGGFLGQQFELMQPDRLDSVLVYVTGGTGYTGQPIAAAIWDMSGGAPNTMIGTTDTLFHLSDSGGVYILPVTGGGLNLSAGNFVVTVIEFDSTAGVGLASEIFTTGTTWVNWPTSPAGGWANNEYFGVAGFLKPYVIRPILNFCPAYVSAMSSTQSACGGATGTASVNVTGGPGPFTYLWSNGQTTQTATNLAAGAYTVTVTDGLGCTVVDQTIVTNPNAPTITSTAIDNALCNGDNGLITPTVTGGSPAYTFVWSTGATTTTLSAPAGTYSVTIVDQSLCSVVATGLTVTEPAALVATVSSTNESAAGANDGSATANVSGGTGAYTYLWSNGGTTQTINGLAAGTYTVTVTDANGCATNSSSTVIVGINDIFGFSVGTYPNPSNGSFMVSISMPEAADFSVTIVDMMGKTVFADEAVAANTYERQINLGEKANGMYFLNVKSASINKTYKIEVRN